MKIIFLWIGLCVAFLQGCAQINSEAQKPITKEGILKDLDLYRDGITDKHIDPFTKISKEKFFEEIAKIKEDTAGKNADEILVSLLKVNAEIGDEHTDIRFYEPMIFPVIGYQFKEGFFIVMTDNDYRGLLNKKVIAINHIPVSTVYEKVATLLPSKNEGFVKTQATNFFVSPTILHGLKIINNKDSVLLTLAGQDNRDTINTIIRAKDIHSISIAKATPGQKELRFSSKKNYWYKYDNDRNYIYFKYAKCFNDPSYPFSEFQKSFFDELKSKNHVKVIIDLRGNMGGSELILFPFIEELAECMRKNVYKVDVLTGSNTFSSAVLNVADLESKLKITTIGESTGGSINHFGEIKTFHLPNSGLTVSYSTKHFVREPNMTGGIKPDVPIEETFTDFINGIDAALNYAIKN